MLAQARTQTQNSQQAEGVIGPMQVHLFDVDLSQQNGSVLKESRGTAPGREARAPAAHSCSPAATLTCTSYKPTLHDKASSFSCWTAGVHPFTDSQFVVANKIPSGSGCPSHAERLAHKVRMPCRWSRATSQCLGWGFLLDVTLSAGACHSPALTADAHTRTRAGRAAGGVRQPGGTPGAERVLRPALPRRVPGARLRPRRRGPAGALGFHRENRCVTRPLCLGSFACASGANHAGAFVSHRTASFAQCVVTA